MYSARIDIGSDTLPRKRNKPQTNTVSIPSKSAAPVTLKRPLSSSESESDSDTDEDTSDSDSSEDSTDSEDSSDSDSDTSSSSGSSSPQAQPIIKTRALPNPTQNVKSTTSAKGLIMAQPTQVTFLPYRRIKLMYFVGNQKGRVQRCLHHLDMANRRPSSETSAVGVSVSTKETQKIRIP
jgi:hypothetical protein